MPESKGKKMDISNVPIGTFAPSFTGGGWYKTPRGWKWGVPGASGSTFPRPGGDWDGRLIEPEAQDK